MTSLPHLQDLNFAQVAEHFTLFQVTKGIVIKLHPDILQHISETLRDSSEAIVPKVAIELNVELVKDHQKYIISNIGKGFQHESI
jgi:hypothetical protein